MSQASGARTLSSLEIISLGIKLRENIATFSFGNEVFADGIVRLFTDKEFLKVLQPIADEKMPGATGTVFGEMKKIKLKCENCGQKPTCPYETKFENGYSWMRSPATNCIWVIFPPEQIITREP